MGDGIDNGNGFLDDAWGWDVVDDDPLPADERGHGTLDRKTIVPVSRPSDFIATNHLPLLMRRKDPN